VVELGGSAEILGPALVLRRISVAMKKDFVRARAKDVIERLVHELKRWVVRIAVPIEQGERFTRHDPAAIDIGPGTRLLAVRNPAQRAGVGPAAYESAPILFKFRDIGISVAVGPIIPIMPLAAKGQSVLRGPLPRSPKPVLAMADGARGVIFRGHPRPVSLIGFVKTQGQVLDDVPLTFGLELFVEAPAYSRCVNFEVITIKTL